jgi:hypothetical protein
MPIGEKDMLPADTRGSAILPVPRETPGQFHVKHQQNGFLVFQRHGFT